MSGQSKKGQKIPYEKIIGGRVESESNWRNCYVFGVGCVRDIDIRELHRPNICGGSNYHLASNYGCDTNAST